MWKIRILMSVILVAFGAWSAWWWIGATAQEKAVEAWFADRRAAGWAAEADSLTVTGYPNRFDTVLEGVTLADPASGWAWRAPEFRIAMLSYQPNMAIATWPPRQTIAAPGERVAVTSDAMRASLTLIPETRLGLDRAVVELAGLTLTSQRGWSAALGSGQLSVRRAEAERGRANAYDAVLEGADLRLPEGLRALLSQDGALPDLIQTLRLDLTAAFAAPLDRLALEGPKPELQTLWLRRSAFHWGEVALEASGRVDFDAEGVPDGKISFRARNWRALLDAAAAAGAIDRGMADALRQGLDFVALLSSDGKALEAPLIFKAGLMFLGPAPLGPAPRLRR